MNTSRRFFISSILGAGIILPMTGSFFNFNIFDQLRYTWKSLELKEIACAFPIRNHTITSRSEDSYKILADTNENRDVLKLNTVAADIWEHCNGINSVDDMVQIIAGHFDVEPDTCRRDIILTLMAFKRKGLILVS